MTQDIREWAKAQGIKVADRGRIAQDVVEAYEMAHEVNGAGDDETPLLLSPTAPEATETPPTPPPPPPATPGERKPQQPAQPRRGLFQRKPAEPPGKKPRQPHRLSTENLISAGWGLGVMAFMRAPQAIPAARVMQVQAPLIGMVGDDLVKGTVADRLLQPLVRVGEKGEIAVAILGPPALVYAMTIHPEWMPGLRPMLKMALTSWFHLAGPKVAEMERRMAAFDGELEGIDLDAWIDSFFADVDLPVMHSAAEDEAVRRAKGE